MFSVEELHDWFDHQTTHLDLIASWENLNSAYKNLEFTDDLNDATRLEEFKWIIKEMNKFLTRARKQLLQSENIEQIDHCLMQMCSAQNQSITDRKSVVFQKLRQMWVLQMMDWVKMQKIEALENMEQMMEQEN